MYIYNCKMIPQHMPHFLKNPWSCLVGYAAYTPKSHNMLHFHCLFPFMYTYLYEQGWILGKANERWSPRTLLFISEMPHVIFECFALSFYLIILVNFWSQTAFLITKNQCQFSHNFWKGRLTVSLFQQVSIHTRQINKRSQQKKTDFWVVLLKSLWTIPEPHLIKSGAIHVFQIKARITCKCIEESCQQLF